MFRRSFRAPLAGDDFPPFVAIRLFVDDLVDAMKNGAFRLASLSRRNARETIRSIQGGPIQGGFRSSPGVDIEAREGILLRVSRMVADLPAVSALHLNPIMPFEKGRGPLVVDVRVLSVEGVTLS
jgi:hypothetical protein